jgi:hypothetical protein
VPPERVEGPDTATDQVDKAPATWQEVYDVAAKNDGIAYMTHEERQSEDIVKFSDASPLKAVYEDPAVKKGAAVRGRAQDRGRAGQVTPGLPGLIAGLVGDLRERHQGAVGEHEPGGRAEAGADRHGQGPPDVLSGRPGPRAGPATLAR